MARIKTGPKIALVVIVALAFVFGLRKAASEGWIPTPGIIKALIPQKVILPDLKDSKLENVAPVPLPGATPAKVASTLIRGEVWEWNAQANLLYANGGASTMDGSLMQKHGVNLLLSRQDSTDQMRDDLVSCSKELHDGSNQCSTGTNFVVIMGDGSGQFAAGADDLLRRLGSDYLVKVIGATGYSRGEDAFLVPLEVKRNPQAARGLLVAGVLRDGDWDIAQKWEGDNNIPNNPDEKTYDSDAVNWMNAPDYIKAAEMYNSGACDDRKVVKDGHLTGEMKHVCVNAVVTWTPGDVNIARGKGGLTKVVSSKQYRSQMPAVIIGPVNFFQKNREEIESMLAATLEAGDQLKAFDQALHKAAAISAKVYKDQDESYWYKYFKGTVERDSQGQQVELGGSAVNNLADEMILFGLEPGTNDNFRSTYSVFRNIVLQQYPSLFKNTPIPEVRDVEDKSFITGAQARMNEAGAVADAPTYAETDSSSVISKRSYSINFETGKATFTPAGEETMRGLKDSISITSLFVAVDGYTDDTGDEQRVNRPLSEARAVAVRDWLMKAAPKNFPLSRFKVEGHGSSNPVASNATAEGKAKNRRVEITLSGS